MPVRNLLRLNAIFSGASGFALFSFSKPLADAFSLSRAPLIVVGIALMIYALDLSLFSVRRGLRRLAVLAFAGADAAWALGAVAVLALWPDAMSVAGRTALAASAVPVAAFAVLQIRGARSLR